MKLFIFFLHTLLRFTCTNCLVFLRVPSLLIRSATHSRFVSLFFFFWNLIEICADYLFKAFAFLNWIFKKKCLMKSIIQTMFQCWGWCLHAAHFGCVVISLMLHYFSLSLFYTIFFHFYFLIFIIFFAGHFNQSRCRSHWLIPDLPCLKSLILPFLHVQNAIRKLVFF